MEMTNEKRRRVLLMYLEFAHKDLEIGRALSASFARELESWGKARMDQIDRLNAIGLIPIVEKEGYKGEERFSEVAKRLDRFRGKDPDERLVRTWWESRNKTHRRQLRGIDGEPIWDKEKKEFVSVDEPLYRAHMDDDVLNRKRGRPRKAASKK